MCGAIEMERTKGGEGELDREDVNSLVWPDSMDLSGCSTRFAERDSSLGHAPGCELESEGRLALRGIEWVREPADDNAFDFGSCDGFSSDLSFGECCFGGRGAATRPRSVVLLRQGDVRCVRGRVSSRCVVERGPAATFRPRCASADASMSPTTRGKIPSGGLLTGAETVRR